MKSITFLKKIVSISLFFNCSISNSKASITFNIFSCSLDNIFKVFEFNFIRNYVDKFHHAKEEDILFKEFNKCAEEGCIHCNPVEQMLFEHDEGRKSVKMMELGMDEREKNKLIEGARNYIQLIREHIYKEDNILYPMADEALS